MNKRVLPSHLLPENILQEKPKIHPSAWIAPGANVISRVTLGEEASVWYHCTLRGDINYIEIGDRSNVQDGSVIHLTNDNPCIVGKEVSVGHHVNLHGCEVQDGALIGIGAIVLTGAVVGKEAIVAAGAVIREGQVVEEGYLYAGVPAKKIRPLTPEERQNNRQMAGKYVAQSRVYMKMA